MAENAFGIMSNRFKCLLTTMVQELHNVTSVLSCVTLYIIWTCYKADHQRLANKEEINHKDIPGAWTQGEVMTDLGYAEQGNNVIVAAKRQKLYLNNYYNNPVRAVLWQNDMM